jgi:tRNA-specific 2-thiouridylase
MLRRPKKTVFVGLSGGVDSSVAALLLQRQGYHVVGVYLKCWEGLVTPRGLQFADSCNWRAERRDAAAVAATLGIPFRTYDFTDKYRREVVDEFFEEYAVGHTPNPDVSCNRSIKFGAFFDEAMRDGADYIATGHYVRRRDTSDGAQILTGVDTTKDQSYFLWSLTQSQLARSLFPVGEFTKVRIRQLANEAHLPTANKKDSQGICFIGPVSLRAFLEAGLTLTPGDIKTLDGRVIGQHSGAALFTVGQRHGVAVSGVAPFYVVRVSVSENIVYVAPGHDNPALFQSVVALSHASWLRAAPTIGQTYTARIRYRQKLVPVTVDYSEDSLLLHFAEPQRAVTPGQSAVLYDGDVVMGGGVIVDNPTASRR